MGYAWATANRSSVFCDPRTPLSHHSAAGRGAVITRISRVRTLRSRHEGSPARGLRLRPRTHGGRVVRASTCATPTWVNLGRFRLGVHLRQRDAWFRPVGVKLSVLHAGRAELPLPPRVAAEGFLVLAGECLLLVEGEERPAAPVGLRPLPGRDGARLRRGGRRAMRDPDGRRADAGRAAPLPGLGARGAVRRERRGRDALRERPMRRFERPREEKPPYWGQLPWA